MTRPDATGENLYLKANAKSLKVHERVIVAVAVRNRQALGCVACVVVMEFEQCVAHATRVVDGTKPEWSSNRIEK